MNDPDLAERRAERDRAACEKAESLLEQKSRELLLVNNQLRHLSETLEARVAERTRALTEATEHAIGESRAKCAFLANMSHEIRTPMSAIVGFAEALLEPRLTESSRAEAVDIVRRNARRLLDVINDILDFSKLEAGSLEVQRIPCPVAAVVAEVISLAGPQIRSKGLTFEADYDGPVPRSIQSDPVRLRQILLNLLDNAAKFTERGSVVLRVSLLDPGFNPKAPDEPCLLFQVSDTGTGMSAAQLANIFVPFVQTGEALIYKHGGTGLGLAISRQLARLLGGEITAQSMHGGGSVFELVLATGPLDAADFDESLPAVLKSAFLPEDAASVSAKWLPDYRILVAEDQPEGQKLLSFLLGRSGADVTVVSDGQKAVELALASRQHGAPFDVILMDMQMPGLDGYSATSRLRSYGYDRPIIALTAHALPSDRARCIAAGCDDYLSKPVDRRKLIETVTQYGRGGVSIKWKSVSGVATGAPGSEAPHGAGAPIGPEQPPVILSALLERCLGDDTLAAKLLASLADRGAHEIERITRAIDQNDVTTARRLLHDLKGSCSYLAALALAEVIGALEATLERSSPADLHALIALLRAEWERFRDFASVASVTLKPEVR